MANVVKKAAVSAGPQKVSRAQAITGGMHAAGRHTTCSHNTPGNGTGLDARRIPKKNAVDFWKE